MRSPQHRNKSWSSKPLNFGSLFSDQQKVSIQIEQTPVKYYIAQQYLKDAFRRQEYVLQQLSQFHEQNILLERIKKSMIVAEKPNNSDMNDSESQSVLEQNDSQIIKIQQSSIKNRTQLYQISQQVHEGIEDIIPQVQNPLYSKMLSRMKKVCGKKDYNTLLNIIQENEKLKQESESQTKYQNMYNIQKQSNKTTQSQLQNSQNKIQQLTKTILTLKNTILNLKQQKQTNSLKNLSFKSLPSTKLLIDPNIVIQQRINKNQRKRLDIEKQTLGKLRVELDEQLYEIKQEWDKYLPLELVEGGKKSILKYCELVKEEYERTWKLNEEIEVQTKNLCNI